MSGKFKTILCIILALLLCFSMTSCKSKNSDVSDDDAITKSEIDDPTAVDYDNGIYFDEEDEEAELSLKHHPIEDYCGTWEATSGQSHYWYGNVLLTVKSNGTWSGVITEEELSGKWTEKDEGLYLTSDLFDCYLSYTDTGKLVMRYLMDVDDPDEEYIVSVLTRKE